METLAIDTGRDLRFIFAWSTIDRVRFEGEMREMIRALTLTEEERAWRLMCHAFSTDRPL